MNSPRAAQKGAPCADHGCDMCRTCKGGVCCLYDRLGRPPKRVPVFASSREGAGPISCRAEGQRSLLFVLGFPKGGRKSHK